ncbi:LysE family translocator [Sulfurospirillum sp. 1612]|uniref:LysE family translocator n=1 Tax=Sulfurospirillum sp. 1612 TaxID=3094835 RepID=UPI002F92813C
MDLIHIVTFTGAIFVFMATPGPGTLAVVSRSLGSGFKHAIMMASGMVLGDIIFLLLSMLGLGMIASTFGTLFEMIKIIGGLYLIYLGYKIIRTKTLHGLSASKQKVSYKGDFISGLFITLGNPKVIVFYVGFLPTFINMSAMTYQDIAIVAGLVLGVLSSILVTYAYFASKAKEAIKKPKAQNIMNKTAGSMMLLIGSLLIIKR